MFMRAEEVVVSNPEYQVIVGAVDVVETICVAVRSFIGAVQPFNHLFEWAVFCRNSIVVGKPNHLGYLERKVFAQLLCELHCGEGIGAVAVSDELKVFQQLCKPPKCHAHGEDAGTDTTVIGDLVADDGAGGGVHDKPDIGFDTADFYVGFISCEDIPFFIGKLIHKRFYADGGGFPVVGDLLVGDAGVIQVFEDLGSFSEGKTEVDMKGEAQGHDMGVVFTEFQRRSILWKGR